MDNEFTNNAEENLDHSDEILTTEECKKFLGQYELPNERVQAIKDNLIGLVDSIINSYIENVNSNEQA